MAKNAMHQFTYGLFVLTAREGDKDNGCIINTAMQVTSKPSCTMIAVNKKNLTHDMIKNTGSFNLSVLTQKASFDTFRRFGFQSGREADKLQEISFARSENGIAYLTEETNAVISAKVLSMTELPTHTLFLAEVTESALLSEDASVTYQYYQDNIKPAPENSAKKKGFICKVCGYIYEGETLPDDFVCPVCKHPASDFEPLA
jgi:flavin reductase (DIM6/NTAB) family NADH-FMN oxidoreductase RutF